MTKFLSGILSATVLSLGLSAAAMADTSRAAIRDGEVMGVRAGMSLDAARQAAGKVAWIYEHRFMVDFSALCAMQGQGAAQQTLFCAIVPEREKEKGADKIEAIAVTSPDLRTAEGLQTGMKVSDAAKILGKASLSYNLENEAREYLSFEKAPEWMNFQARSETKLDGFAGVYGDKDKGSSHRTTSNYAVDAVIDTIWLY